MDAPLDLTKDNGRLTQKRIFLQLFHTIAGRCQHISHAGNGIHALLRAAGVSCLSVHSHLKPIASLVGSLDFSVGRLRIHHQAVFCDPAKLDHSFRAGHISLFITGPDPL